MFKLTIVGGPGRGTSHELSEGENGVGRHSENRVRLEGARVSKRHCTFVVDGDHVLLRDDGSSNGTFVNGQLVRNRTLRRGDRISVGETVFELVRASRPRVKRTTRMPSVTSQRSFPPALPGSVPSVPSALPGPTELDPSLGADLSSPWERWLEEKAMPFFYEFILKNEWRTVMGGVLGVFVLGCVLLAVTPVISEMRQTAQRELGRRAQLIARQIVERNTPALVGRSETRTDIGSLDREEGVRLAVLIDLDSRILAPANRYNQTLTLGDEAKFATRARDQFRKGREQGILIRLDSSTLAAAEPLKVYDPQLGRNTIVAMAIVSVDSGMADLSFGEQSMAYSQALILVGLLAVALFFIAYRMTLRPFEVLNVDIDKALKGEIAEVTREFRFSELRSLWDVINAAVQRAAQSSSDPSLSQAGLQPEDFADAFRLMSGAQGTGNAFVLCDSQKRILALNSTFEEVTGIRQDAAQGQELSSVARDQAFSSLVTDLLGRCQPGADSGAEDFEFSGVAYRVSAAALGSLGGMPQGYVLMAERVDE